MNPNYTEFFKKENIKNSDDFRNYRRTHEYHMVDQVRNKAIDRWIEINKICDRLYKRYIPLHRIEKYPYNTRVYPPIPPFLLNKQDWLVFDLKNYTWIDGNILL
jgi:hypothetical protein